MTAPLSAHDGLATTTKTLFGSVLAYFIIKGVTASLFSKTLGRFTLAVPGPAREAVQIALYGVVLPMLLLIALSFVQGMSSFAVVTPVLMRGKDRLEEAVGKTADDKNRVADGLINIDRARKVVYRMQIFMLVATVMTAYLVRTGIMDVQGSFIGAFVAAAASKAGL